ncbi:glycoside hydrolase family 79 protein [Thelephora ganbajun]|uniref:Glycoside hydrolase family 79 protein n=1 Tax=Thelephora ganbajun TaxID=370292 RepID=A0ACB6ZIB1_THEGA|nr:glycoside hydrolase family 79 protein [Thelephora ganbajun]
MSRGKFLALASSCILFVRSAIGVTVYGQGPLGATRTIQPDASWTGLPAYDPTTLTPPVVSPLPTPYFLQLTSDVNAVGGVSIPIKGSFYGFSIEVSVVDQILGKNSSFIQVPFLNLMATLASRGGEVHIRVGGNTQDYTTLVDHLDKGNIIQKQSQNTSNPTDTPALLFTRDLLYMMNNISNFVPVKWYLGIPLNDTTNLRLQIVTEGERILGNNIIGFQVGNEPDLYVRHQHRPTGYGPQDYFNEFQMVVNALAAINSVTDKNNLIGPSMASADWQPSDVWNTGFQTAFGQHLKILSVERYPNDNCAAIYPALGPAKDPQTEFPNYLNHGNIQSLTSQYTASTLLAQSVGKPFHMFETNTASCGGFKGISNSFGAALWATDYGFQMAHSNFSEALLHVGGQHVYYNPFISPPTTQTGYHQWTVGAVFYASLILAEAFGKSGTSRIIDLAANNGNVYTPAYAIWQNGVLSKLALFNYVSDPSDAAVNNVTFAIGGGQTGQPAGTPTTVKVKYLLSQNTASRNITWANQTFGQLFESDGRLMNNLHIDTVTCNNDNTCIVRVPAPGFALVFITDDPTNLGGGDPIQTYTTTAYPKIFNTATVDPSQLATSNGHSGKDRVNLGSTSYGSRSGAIGLRDGMREVLSVIISCAVGWFVIRGV